ncbi:MAG: holo-ACP synthase [Mongoliitalea sp.]
MIKTFVGNDIEEVARFGSLLNRKNHLLERIFFEQEFHYAIKKKNPDQTLTGIWCAKEAVKKAFAPILALEVTQIEIIKNPKGYPEAIIHHPAIGGLSFHLSVSISHTKNLATATALLQM